MDVFEINRTHLFDLISKSSKDGFKENESEHEAFVNNYLNKSIKQCDDDKRRHPDSVGYFDLVEGEVYYHLSGLSHDIFKVVSKVKSQYEGIPYYQVRTMKKHYCAAEKARERSSVRDTYNEETQNLSNGMIFSRYKHIPGGDYSKVCDFCINGFTIDTSGPFPVYKPNVKN